MRFFIVPAIGWLKAGWIVGVTEFSKYLKTDITETEARCLWHLDIPIADQWLWQSFHQIVPSRNIDRMIHKHKKVFCCCCTMYACQRCYRGASHMHSHHDTTFLRIITNTLGFEYAAGRSQVRVND